VCKVRPAAGVLADTRRRTYDDGEVVSMIHSAVIGAALKSVCGSVRELAGHARGCAFCCESGAGRMRDANRNANSPAAG